ncbi:chemotaxis protein CheW [Effusibacillus lacus]|uniref:Chemotaxis protein CheW n=1 Tax=Effusibacillus lacus TaxID=1348429 RepID=A0A292YPX1_9BACL|nr:chemotaxis protein CheW [Effusibacillus lacus]TCS73141.1 purine-binding chemotaxis protein CheW [Effusibacillus lacus]GAX90545.1 chemotaxis protein CheW [Effusibacillus lacus]
MLDKQELEQNVKENKYIVFRLLDEEYGVEVNQVRSIERMQRITRVPRTPGFVKGVINLRGVVTPIIDLKTRFGLGEENYTETTRIIIVATDEMEVGLIVDSANDVIDISTDSIEPPPEVVGGIRAAYLEGVAKLQDRLLILLNLDKVLNSEELQQLGGMEK